MKDKKVLRIKLVEIGGESVSYRDFNNLQGPVLMVQKSEIFKIKTESGKEIQIDQLGDNDYYHKTMIKSDIFSLTNGKLTFGLERSIKPNRTYEVQLGIMGVGVVPDEEVSKLDGGFVRLGYKFKRSPEYYSNKGKSTNYFKGGYFKPEIVSGWFVEERKVYDWHNSPWYDPYVYQKRNVAYAAIIGNFGMQWTIGDNIAFDYYVGMGLGTSTVDDSDYKGLNYAVVAVNNIYMQMGLKLGLMF